jgi:hypothetical protein
MDDFLFRRVSAPSYPYGGVHLFIQAPDPHLGGVGTQGGVRASVIVRKMRTCKGASQISGKDELMCGKPYLIEP